MILYVPNDPLARAEAPEREQAPRADPPAGRAALDLASPEPEAVYPLDSPGFLSWQCREAALAALEAADAIGAPLVAWHGGKDRLALRPNAGWMLNAEYDRAALSFYAWKSPGKLTFAGASTVRRAARCRRSQSTRPSVWFSTV